MGSGPSAPFKLPCAGDPSRVHDWLRVVQTYDLEGDFFLVVFVGRCQLGPGSTFNRAGPFGGFLGTVCRSSMFFDRTSEFIAGGPYLGLYPGIFRSIYLITIESS